LSDVERRLIQPLLPNTQHGVARVVARQLLNGLKHLRQIATRYEKFLSSYLAAVLLDAHAFWSL